MHNETDILSSVIKSARENVLSDTLSSGQTAEYFSMGITKSDRFKSEWHAFFKETAWYHHLVSVGK